MESAKSYPEFISKYHEFRAEVYKQTPIAIGMAGVKLSPINSLALAAYMKWSGNNRLPPNGGWDWGSWVSHYRSHHHKRFEAAIWFGSTLCGLCLGKASEKNVHVRLEILEGSTEKYHPLKGRVAYIALTAIELYGYSCGSEEVRIIDPVDGAITSYRKLGYELMNGTKKSPRYLVKKL